MTRKRISNEYLSNIGPSHIIASGWHNKGYNVQVTGIGRHYLVEAWYGPVEAEGSRQSQSLLALGDRWSRKALHTFQKPFVRRRQELRRVSN
jgi:hypothetical protein